jgi:hypothetical protein
VLRVLAWLGLGAVVAGLVGYGLVVTGTADDVPVRLPVLGQVSGALALAGAGALIVLLVLLVGRPLAAARARRFRARTDRKLRDATTTVAREVVGPVRRVLRDHADARAALLAAGGKLRA